MPDILHRVGVKASPKDVYDVLATRDGDAGSAGQPAGTGMGLAIARGIVEAHGGRIWVEGRAGSEGARVMFTLPIGDEDTVADWPRETAPRQTAAEAGEMDRVL